VANHQNPHGGPYALKDPLLYAELNDLIDAVIASPNFDAGSAHAPTDDIELSGSMGGGFLFDDLFPLRGDVDVTDGFILDAATSGFVRFTERVSVDVFSTLSFKAVSGSEGPGAAVWETGSSATFNGTSSLTLASTTTTNLNGTVNLRGNVLFRSSANGGPAQVLFEDGTLLHVDDNCQLYIYTNDMRVRSGAVCTWESSSTSTWASGSTANVSGAWNWKSGANVDVESGGSFEFESGSTLALLAGSTATSAGSFTFTADTYPLLSSRTWTRRATGIAGTTHSTGFDVPDMITTLDPTTAVPIFETRPATATGEKSTIALKTPPHGSTIVTVSVVADGTTTTAPTFPTYRVVRWRDGEDAYENMSDTVTDTHDGTGDWGSNTRTTVLTINAHATIDSSYRYGVRVFHPYAGATSAVRVFDVFAEGTRTSIQE